ncbi:unnamed protein product [Effrenium voratum]|nr:unnamed protein product [Effrenium voratum]
MAPGHCWLGVRRSCGLCRQLFFGASGGVQSVKDREGTSDLQKDRSLTCPARTCSLTEKDTNSSKVTNVDYSRFERIVKQDDLQDGPAIAVAVCGRKGWNSEVVNGVYRQDGVLNGRARLRKSDGTRWLKFTDNHKWMISRFPDGRPLGEAVAEDAAEDPRRIREPWHVCTEELSWEMDELMSVTPGECSGCGQLLRRALRCSQCRGVSYCDLKCQKADWQFHRRSCSRKQCIRLAESAAGEQVETGVTSAQKTQDKSHPSSRPTCTSSKIRCRKHAASGTGSWEEVQLLPWARERLMSLLGGSVESNTSFLLLSAFVLIGPQALEGLPELRVSMPNSGRVEVIGVKEIDGLASMWPNQGEKRHLFDLSFQVVFKATWLADVGMMSMDGSVYFDDFTSNLGNHAEAVYGMSIDFANSSESVVEMQRKAMQETIGAAKASVQEALGADGWSIAQGRGLMHLVHLRLRRFALDFEAK